MLAACGGGGGDDAAQAPATTTSFDVSGVAAKGVMAGAIVTAHAVNADGTIRSQALATALQPTDASGRYTLHFDGPPAQPYVIQVTVPEGGATHRDEATNTTQALPPGFTMRALVVPTTASVTANITPFSEMATEAAEDAGITTDSAQQANNTVKSMLGLTTAGDLATVPVQSTTDASTADAQRLAVMLTAVSQMAASGAAGCTDADGGARTQCVVQALSNATTSTSSYALSGNVAPALSTALQTVLATPSLVGNVPPSVLAPAVAALECEGVACNAPAPAPALNAGEGIAATKTLFTDVRSDVAALFGGADATEPGALTLEKNKFGAALSGVEPSVDLLTKDIPALAAGVKLFADYTAGRLPANQPWGGSGMASCYVVQDAQGTQATAPANARSVSCTVFYGYDYATSTDYSHGITLTPGATADAWTYTAAAVKTQYQPFSPTTPTQPTSTIIGRASGTLTAAVDANGVFSQFDVDGKLPAAFGSSGQVASASNVLSIHGARTAGAAGSAVSATTTLSGSLVAQDSGGATLSTLQVKSASITEIPSSRSATGSVVAPGSPLAQPGTTGSELATASFDVLWSAPAAEFEGVFAATDSAWDKSGVRHIPTRVTLEGRASTVDSGVKTDILQGKLSVVVAGFDQYDALAAASASNFYTLGATLGAQVTAPNRPLLAVTFGTNWKSFEAQPKTATLQYRSFVGGTPRTAISLDANIDAQGLATLTLAETIKDISVTVRQGATSADVLLDGTTKIGVLDLDQGIITFTDGTFVSGL
jgi:hypothetical protein